MKKRNKDKKKNLLSAVVEFFIEGFLDILDAIF